MASHRIRVRVLITGATGFVAPVVCREAAVRGLEVRASVRSGGPARILGLEGVEIVPVGDIDGSTDWSKALRGVDAVIHLAGRAHQFGTAAEDDAGFTRVNVAGTERLARCAAEAGVRRLVLLSSVKVNGERSLDRPFTETDDPNPTGPYARSKLAAERVLATVRRETGLSAVVIRTPLVYGPGVKANFLAMLRAVERGLPLPLGGVNNTRSLIYVRNLADALLACAQHPDADGHTFFVKDGEDVSTAELLRRIGHALGKNARLVPVPSAVLHGLARLVGRSDAAVRLLGSLAVNSSAIRECIGWVPPFDMDAGLADTARWLRDTRAPR